MSFVLRRFDQSSYVGAFVHRFEHLRTNYRKPTESSKSSKTLSNVTVQKVLKIKRCSARCKRVARREERRLHRRGGTRGGKLNRLLLRVLRGSNRRHWSRFLDSSFFSFTVVLLVYFVCASSYSKLEFLWDVSLILSDINHSSTQSLNSLSKLSFACFAYSSCRAPFFFESKTSTEKVPLNPVLRIALVTLVTGRYPPLYGKGR